MNASDLEPDELVAALAGRSESTGESLPADVRLLVGYVGHGRDGRVRVFTNAELRSYIDVPPDAVRRRRRFTDPEDGMGERSLLWVDAEVFREQVDASTAEALEAEFLQGGDSPEVVVPVTLGLLAQRRTFWNDDDTFGGCQPIGGSFLPTPAGPRCCP